MPPGAIVLSQMRQTAPSGVSEGPEPGILETIGAGFTVARADTTGQAEAKEAEAYLEIANEIERLGGARASSFINPSTGTVSPEGVWAAMDAYRKQGRFKTIPRTREEFDEQWKARERARIEAAQRTAARGNQAAAFVGGAGGSMTDPVNLYTLPLGGASKSVWSAMLQGAIINVGIEGVMTPTVQSQRRALERPEMTGTEIATNIGMAAIGGGVLAGGGKFISDNWGAIKSAPRDVQEKAWGAILDRTPGLRDKVGGKIDWDALDPHLADIAEATIDRTRMTDAERGAIAALRREQAIDQANPFVPNGAGTASHYAMLGDTLQGIINESPVYTPKVRPSPAARLRTGTSVATGITGDAMQTVKARIGVVESNNSATAKNPRSSAMGLYQFTDGTWLSYYKARFGSQGLSDRQILAKKADTGLQNTLMDDLLGDNAKALQDAGFAADAGNLYLAHFAGHGGATKVLRADPATPVAQLLGQKVVDANPFLRGMTAGDLTAWAQSKMGGAGSAAPVAGRPGDAPEADPFAALDREIADTQAEIARLDTALEAGTRGIDETLADLGPDPVPVVDATPAPRIGSEGVAPRTPIDTAAPDLAPRADGRAQVMGMTPEARAIMPELRRIIEGERGVSLNRPAQLSARLGVDERNLQSALQQMAIDGLVIQSAKGTYARPPRRMNRPLDVLEYVASTGGVTPKGFSQSLMAKLPNMENPPRGHDLATIFQVSRKVRWKRKPTANDPKGVPLAEPSIQTRPALIPGFGPIVRNSGRGLDEIGEDLWEAGYFGAPDSTPRPTESEVIDLLQNAFGNDQKVYSIFDQAQAADMEAASLASGVSNKDNPFASDFQSDEHFVFEWNQFDAAADEAFGITLDEDAFTAAWGEYRTAGDGDIAGAVLRTIQREIEDVQAREIAERGDVNAADIIDEWEAALRQGGILGDEEGAGRLFDAGDAGPDGTTWEPVGWEETGPLNPERWQAWDEPDGPAAKIDTDSMEHDLRTQVEPYSVEQMTFADVYGERAAMSPDEAATPLRVVNGRLGQMVEQNRDGSNITAEFRSGPSRSLIDIQIMPGGVAKIDVDGFEGRLAQESGSASSSANRFGPAVIRDAYHQLRALYPEITAFEGKRLTGAGAGRTQQVSAGEPSAPAITAAADGQADFAAPTGAQVRTALERQTEGGIRPTGPQRAPGSDGGLFDTRDTTGDVFEQMGFRLDEEGDVINPADLLAEFDEDAAFLKTVRDCL